MAHKFLLHDPGDNVAVAVADLTEGDKAYGVILENKEKTEELKVKGNIPLSHKIAVAQIKKGAEIIKYGVVIGKAKEDIAKGDYVHDHNITSVRWNYGN